MRAWGAFALIAVLAACGNDEQVPAPSGPVLSGDLDLDIRDKATVTIEADGESSRVTLTASKGFGVLPQGVALTGAGSIERFPEADGTLYTARLSGPKTDGGPCGDQPVSIGFSLHRDESNARVSGGMAVYCGASVWHGTPVRMLRLAGSLGP